MSEGGFPFLHTTRRRGPRLLRGKVGRGPFPNLDYRGGCLIRDVRVPDVVRHTALPELGKN